LRCEVSPKTPPLPPPGRRISKAGCAFMGERSFDREAPPQILIRMSSFGQTQYIPPGLSSDLITLVATMAVLQFGQSLPAELAPLSPILARAVLLILFSAINYSPRSQPQKDCIQTRKDTRKGFITSTSNPPSPGTPNVFVHLKLKTHVEIVLKNPFRQFTWLQAIKNCGK